MANPWGGPLSGTSDNPKIYKHLLPLFYHAQHALLRLTLGSGASTFSSHLITKQLALLALRLSTVYEERQGLVECSVVFFRQGVQEICAKEKHAKVGEEEVLSRNRSFISSLCDFRVLWIVIRISCWFMDDLWPDFFCLPLDLIGVALNFVWIQFSAMISTTEVAFHRKLS